MVRWDSRSKPQIFKGRFDTALPPSAIDLSTPDTRAAIADASNANLRQFVSMVSAEWRQR
jgi:hypothetical protein